jgi:hypothetical protein
MAVRPVEPGGSELVASILKLDDCKGDLLALALPHAPEGAMSFRIRPLLTQATWKRDGSLIPQRGFDWHPQP